MLTRGFGSLFQLYVYVHFLLDIAATLRRRCASCRQLNGFRHLRGNRKTTGKIGNCAQPLFMSAVPYGSKCVNNTYFGP